LTIFLLYHPCYAKEDEETYDISLVKTADVGKTNEVREIDGKKVLAETYTVKDGEHLWQILREKKLLEKRNLLELISTLKRLNGSLGNIDMIHPGDKIIIPLAISPVEGASKPEKTLETETVPIEALKDIDLDEYVVKQGDSIIKIIEGRYDIPHKVLYNEYLSKLKELNPSIKDLNHVYPGQRVRMPIYSSQMVRAQIKEPKPVAEPMTETQKGDIKRIARQLGEIFTLMGEQWLQKGEHFFPLKTGGQLKLNADSYPIVDLGSGKKVIVDLYDDLPEKMGDLITSNWDNYGIVHLEGDDDLSKAFDRILKICGYKKIYGAGEPFVSGREIPIRITADVIIEQDRGSVSGLKNLTAINFCNEDSPRTPKAVVDFLESSGIKIIDYPTLPETEKINYDDLDVMDSTDNLYTFVKQLLDITGQDYSTNVELPVYQSERADLNLDVKVDFSVKVNGRDNIIDLSGLGMDIINLLQEHQVMVHSVSNKRSSSDNLIGLLDFLGIKYEARLNQFLSTNGPESKNIMISIQGIKFSDKNSKNIFASSLKLPREIIRFLNMNSFRVLQMPVNFTASKGE